MLEMRNLRLGNIRLVFPVYMTELHLLSNTRDVWNGRGSSTQQGNYTQTKLNLKIKRNYWKRSFLYFQ